MATPPTDPVELLLRNVILLQQFGNTLSGEAKTRLNALFEELVGELAKADPAGVSGTYQRRRVERFLENASKLSRDTYRELERETRALLVGFGVQQSEVSVDVLVASVGDGRVAKLLPISPNMARSIVTEDPIHGNLLKSWFQDSDAATMRRVRQQVQLGMAQNETIDQMTARLIGRRSGRGRTGGVLATSKRDAEAIARTAANHISNRAAIETYKKSSVTTTWRWTSTLDSRTSDICMARDGEVYRYDDPSAPTPPAHPNCRSFASPVVDWERLGIDPPEEGTRASRTLTVSDGEIKVTGGKQVPSSVRYSDWLKDQPNGVQDEILGPSRAKLFRENRISLRDLVKSDGRRVTLDELRTK